ncbi:MAG: DUF2752 domain-containing protein [Lachnospiraceae bacterium]|nr:DUF2752 domain-containing protein [Lachnospiraceae bacterium]
MDRNYGIRNIELFSKYCYYVGLGIGLIGLLCVAFISWLHIPVADMLPTCSFYTATGYYCPGCGGTRAVMALLHGEIIKSLYYHPFVAYILGYYVVYEISHVLEMVTRGKVKGLHFCPPYFYIGIVVIIIQWAVKNYLRFKIGFLL